MDDDCADTQPDRGTVWLADMDALSSALAAFYAALPKADMV